ncbi:MAG TPA: response regulator [Labilithrix sp.]|jgi:DNA-binding response OmpR family regulator|nr:response regulator [Labilithrix sp.]
MRVLIIEDSDSIVRMIEALVSARGFEVRSASSGARGLEEAFSWRPHVILLDINLPGSYDGITVCQKIRADDALQDTPVIVISATNDDEVKRRVHEAGATVCYEKPFSPMALLKEMESLQRRSGQMKVAPASSSND